MATSETNSSCAAGGARLDPLNSVDRIFSSYHEQVDADQSVRESIRETTKPLDKYSRQLQSQLQRIHSHSTNQSTDLKKLCEESRAFLQTQINPLWKDLENKVPTGDYFHYNDIWRQISQRIVSSCALIYYLDTETLASQEIIADMMGLKTNPKEANLYLDLEDYLQGVLQLASELARFSVNCVVNGDYSRPVRIGQFISDLSNGFRELNLKNDYLRKRYDGLKYDMKKVEEVIYDVSIRGLAFPTNATGTAAGTSRSREGEPPQPPQYKYVKWIWFLFITIPIMIFWNHGSVNDRIQLLYVFTCLQILLTFYSCVT